MELRVEKEEFLKGLTRAQSVIEKKSTLPVLANVLIRAQQDQLELAATDLEVSIRGTYAAKVVKPGAVTLPAKRLFEIVRELPEGEVHLTDQDNAWVNLRYENGQMLLAGLPADDFPASASVEEEGLVRLERDLLADMIDKTAYAMASDETRYYLNGVFLEAASTRGKPTTLRMVATDGHRLSTVAREMPAALEIGLAKGGVILPRKGVGELRKLLAEAEEEILFGIRDRNAVVKSGNQCLSIRLIDGGFPDYNRVIPQSSRRVLSVEREPLLRALRRIQIVSAEMNRGVKFTMTRGGLELSSNNPSLGEARESIAAKYDGEDLEVGFNARFFLDVLGVIADGAVRVELNDELSPALVRTESAEGFSAVIMPMRL